MMQVFMTLFAAACGCGAIWHEAAWQRRKHWKRTRGVVVGHVEQDSSHPRIEYETEAGTRRFVSLYGGTCIPHVGAEVIVWHAPDCLKAEWFTITNRWLFTIVPAALCVFFLYMAWFVPGETHPGTSPL